MEDLGRDGSHNRKTATDWINLVKNGVQYRAFVVTVMNFRFRNNRGIKVTDKSSKAYYL